MLPASPTPTPPSVSYELTYDDFWGLSQAKQNGLDIDITTVKHVIEIDKLENRYFMWCAFNF